MYMHTQMQVRLFPPILSLSLSLPPSQANTVLERQPKKCSRDFTHLQSASFTLNCSFLALPPSLSPPVSPSHYPALVYDDAR
jgi:hypothetical protein